MLKSTDAKMGLTRQASKKITESFLGTGASTMSLSSWEKKAKCYQIIISLFILIIAFISFMQMLLGVFLVKFYHITTLGFSDDWFVTTPYILTGLGASVIFISILGLVIIRYENRPFLIIIAIFFSISFLAQLYALYSLTEISAIVTNDNIEDDDINDFMRKYSEDGEVAEAWDNMQTGLRCCGAHGKEMKGGHENWKHYLQFPPNSCCHKPGLCHNQNRIEIKRGQAKTNPCGCDTRDKDSKEMYRTGCVGLLLELLKKDIFKHKNIFLGVGCFLCIMELIVVVLCFTYNSRLSRRIAINKMLS